MTMTKQIDVGYSVPPNQLDAVDKKQIRVLFAGDDVKSQKGITGRVIIASSDFLASRRPVAAKFMHALDECINWAYAHQDESAKMYAALNKIDANIAAKGMAFYDRSALTFGPITRLDDIIKQAVDAKFIEKAPTDVQLKDLVDIVYTP